MKFTSLIFLLAGLLLAVPSVVAQPSYVQRHALIAPANLQSNGNLGSSCAMSGNRLVLGAPADDTNATDAGVVKVFDATTGDLLLTLTDPDPEGTDQFGTALAISGDRLVVSAQRDRVAGVQAGSVYVYDLGSATPTTPVISIASPVVADLEFFGCAVSLSGNRLAVGARNNDQGATNTGRAYVFDLGSATPDTPVQMINNPSPAAGDQFGSTVAIDGNTLVVGAGSDDATATDGGAAYVYDLASGTPTTPAFTLNNPDPQASDLFGSLVLVSGSRVVVGALGNTISALANAGTAYVYDLAGGTPTTPVTTIDNPFPGAGEFFSTSMSLDGNRLVVGASRDLVSGISQAGRAFVYDLASAAPSVPVQSLTKPSPATSDQFASAVAVSGNLVLVGAFTADVAAPNAGAGYLFDLASATPTIPKLSLMHASAAAENHFGAAVSVAGSLIAVGQPEDDITGNDAGSVAIYDLNSATPATPIRTINTPQPTLNGRFGAAVALEGTRLVVGAPNDFAGAVRAGVTYVFDLAGASPSVPVLTLNKPSPVLNDQFGSAVAVSGSLVVVGARADDTGATDAGTMYVYDMASATPSVPVYTINNPSPAAQDNFAWSVAISGNRVVVGAVNDNTGATAAGIAYVYDLGSASPAVPALTLANPQPNSSDIFGSAVAIDGSRVVVAARGNAITFANVGSVYEYDLTSATPTTPVHTIDHPSPAAQDQFGFSVALSGANLVVGVPGNDTGTADAGKAFVYNLASATPSTPVASINNPSPSTTDNFGSAVAIQGTRIVVGVPNSDLSGRDEGAAYVYEPPSTNASLAGLLPSLGTLSPAFDSTTIDYSIALPGGTSSITLTPAAAQAGATITVNGNAVTSGNASGSIPLTFGANTITVVVTAEDQTTTKTYTITANVAGSGTLAFASPVFTVASSAGGSTADIVVQRSVSSEGAITCTLSSTDGSAVAPTHYTAQSSTPVSLANGVTTAHISIPITAGATTTAAKVFTVALADINSGATLGSPSTATVVILPPASATELAKPVIAFTAPANAATIVDALPVTVSGTATDNVGVAKVQLSLNNAAFSDVAVASPGATSTPFATGITPAPGLNTVRIRALDFKGNISAIVTRTFTHLRTLTVSVAGPANSGSVSTGFVPTSSRQAGRSYTIVATAKPGFVFDGWTVNNTADTGITPLKMELPTLTFIMQPSLTLTANFIVNPFNSGVTGDFSGLVTASASQPAGGTVISNSTTGLCTAKLSTTGALTGSIKIDGLSLPIIATCDNTGVARFGLTRAKTVNLLRPGKSWLVLALKADLTGATNRLTGTLTEFNKSSITAQSNVIADRHHFNGTTSIVPATYVKSYTGRLKARASQGVGFTSHDYPQGDGCVTFKVLANGSVTMSGRLADDTPVTMSGNLSQAKHWPIFQALYGNKGCIAADAVLDDTQADTDATALNMLWFRPFQNVQWYPYGWNEGIYTDMLASKYTPAPATVFPGLAATNPATGNTDLTFTDGLLAASVTKFVNLTTANVLTKAPATDTSFTFAPTFSTGLIGGTFTHADGTGPKWQGVLMQKGANKGGHGYFLSSRPATLNYLGESGAMHWLAK